MNRDHDSRSEQLTWGIHLVAGLGSLFPGLIFVSLCSLNLSAAETVLYQNDFEKLDSLALTSNDCILQENEIENGLNFDAQNGTPHISRYDILEFIY